MAKQPSSATNHAIQKSPTLPTAITMGSDIHTWLWNHQYRVMKTKSSDAALCCLYSKRQCLRELAGTISRESNRDAQFYRRVPARTEQKPRTTCPGGSKKRRTRAPQRNDGLHSKKAEHETTHASLFPCLPNQALACFSRSRGETSETPNLLSLPFGRLFSSMDGIHDLQARLSFLYFLTR